MRPIISIGVTFIVLMSLFATFFSTALPIIEKTRQKTYYGNSHVENGTVTISIHQGFNPPGYLFSHVGYTIDVDNTRGTKPVAFYSNVTYHYLFHNAYDECNAILPPLVGHDASVFELPLPMYPFKVTFDVTTNTSTNLSLHRTGIMLFNCHILFIKGSETITGPS